MKLFEKILLIYFAVAFFMKYALIQGSTPLISGAVAFLGIYYFPFGFLTLSRKKESYPRMFLSGMGLFLALSYTAILFLIQKWPYSGLWIGIAGVCTLLLAVLTFMLRDKYQNFYADFRVRNLVVVFWVLISMMLYWDTGPA